MQTRIISGFPGVGKSECTKANPAYLDSDSSQYSWKRNDAGEIEKDSEGKNIRHPDFPTNYIEHIKHNVGKVPVIFVSSHKDVRNALTANGLPFTLVYPDRALAEEYTQRYEGRGSPKPLVDLIKTNWHNFLDELASQEGCAKIELKEGQFLSDVIDQAIAIPATGFAAKYPKRDVHQPDGSAVAKK